MGCRSVFVLTVAGKGCRVGEQCHGLAFLPAVLGTVQTPVGQSLTTLCLLQLEGAFPDTMTKCAELLNRTIDVDFVDINVGCPIDLVYKKVMALEPGAGVAQAWDSALAALCLGFPIWTQSS